MKQPLPGSGTTFFLRASLLFLLAAFPLHLAAQQFPADGRMQQKETNFTSFTTVANSGSVRSWEQFNDPKDYDHPEFGKLPKDAPCATCVEVLSKRTEDERYFVNTENPAEFFQQKALGDLHTSVNGDWITIDHTLDPVAPDVFESTSGTEPAGFHTAEKRSYIKTVNGTVFFNDWQLFTATDGVATDRGLADWSHYTAGEDGIYVTDIFPGIDAEMRVFRGSVKTNFILKENRFGAFDELVFRDRFSAPQETSVAFAPGESELNVFSGASEVLHIGEAVLFARNGPKALTRNGGYRLNGNAVDVVVPYDWIAANIGQYTLVVDPTVTGTATLAQASITGSRYNGSCNFTNSCDYTLAVSRPANSTVTDVAWTFTYSANGSTCWLQDGGIRIGVGACNSPSTAGYYWFCNAIGGGTCSGTNQTIYSDVASCMPAPSCTAQNVTFTLKFYRSCWGASGCGNACIGAASPWTMTITGKTIEYTNTASPLTVSATTVCAGGAITASTAGAYGVPGYTYNWSFSPSGTPSVGSGASASITFPTAGSTTLYSIVTDACGNQVTYSQAINVTNGPAITVNSATICPGGSATLTASGGTTYTWSPATNLSATTGATVTASPPATTTYTVTGTTSGCSGTTTATVTLGPNPVITFNSPTICPGGSATLTASGATTYTWSPATNLSATTGATVTANPSATTSYTVTGLIAGCTGTATATVTVNPTPVITVNSPTICPGAAATLTASGATTYAWSPATNLSATTGPTVTADPPATTAYTVTGTTAGCSGTATATVTVSTPPSVTVNSPTICAGASTTLTASGATTYMWSPATDLSATTGASVTANPALTTTYTVTGTTSGCSGTATSTVTVSPNPVISVNSPTICAGASATLTASGATAYSWSPATNLSATTGATVTADPPATTTYTVTGTTAGCTGTATSTVTVNPNPVIAVNSPTICAGASATLTASGATTFSWSPATNLSATTGATVTATPPAMAGYTVTGTENGCSSTASATVSVTPNPVITVNSPTICAGASGTLTASGATTYSWSPATDLSATTGATVTASPAATTTYTVTGTSNGCSGTAAATVTVNPNPVVTVNSATICAGSAIGLTANGATSYAWSPSANLSSATGATVTANPPATTTYTVTGTTAGCTGTGTATVTVDPLPVVTAANNGPLCPGDQLDLSATPSGAAYSWTGPASFVSSNQAPSVTGVTSANMGTYTVQVTVNGCTNSASTTVTMNSGSSTAINAAGPFCADDGIVTLTSVTPGGTWSGTGIVNPAAGTFDPALAQPGGNTVTYDLGPGSCTQASSVTITVNALPAVSFTADNLSGCGPLPVTFTNTSFVQGQQAIWDFGDNSNGSNPASATHSYNDDGCYTVTLTVTDVAGCSNSLSQPDLICVVPRPDAEFFASPGQATVTNPEFHFINQSSDASSYQWYFGDGQTATSVNASHLYDNDPGSYEVLLIAENAAGCVDSTKVFVTIVEDLVFFIPNAFTPNGDESNNVFQPVFTSGFDAFSFEMRVYNRWGETIFESHNADAGWDGTYAGALSKAGTYAWTIQFRSGQTDEKHSYSGHVVLVQ